MSIDLTNPDALTIEAVRDLIASKDDSRSRQLRISEDGKLFLSDDIGFNNLAGVRLRFVTFSRGTNRVGLAAARDEDWVRRVFNAIKKHWEAGTRGYVEIIDL